MVEMQDSWLVSGGEHALQNYGYQKAQLLQQCLYEKSTADVKHGSSEYPETDAQTCREPRPIEILVKNSQLAS